MTPSSSAETPSGSYALLSNLFNDLLYGIGLSEPSVEALVEPQDVELFFEEPTDAEIDEPRGEEPLDEEAHDEESTVETDIHYLIASEYLQKILEHPVSAGIGALSGTIFIAWFSLVFVNDQLSSEENLKEHEVDSISFGILLTTLFPIVGSGAYLGAYAGSCFSSLIETTNRRASNPDDPPPPYSRTESPPPYPGREP